MLEKEQMLDILENSSSLRVADLQCKNIGDCFYITSKDMEKNPEFFKAKLLSLQNKFIVTGSNEKTAFAYEYVKFNDFLIDVVNLTKFGKQTEILCTTDKNKKELSINLLDKNENSRYVLGIGDCSFSLTMENKYGLIQLRYDLTSDHTISYKEKSQNQTFYLDLNRKMNHILLTTSTQSNQTTESVENILLSPLFTNYINSFFSATHIQKTIDYVFSKIEQEIPNLYSEIQKFNIYKDLVNDYEKTTATFFSKMFGMYFDMNEYVDKKKIVQIEKAEQKQLHI